MKPKIVVVGSSNTDMTLKLHHLPRPGETVIDGEFQMAPGGKGANQAVAAARAGGDVTFLSRVGNDLFGSQALEGFRKEGLNTDFVGIDSSAASGIALIFVDTKGENSIGVGSGSNSKFLPPDLAQAVDQIISADVLLVQLEIPLPTVEAAVRLAAEAGVRVILNPAPARQINEAVLRKISVLTPNETEAEALSGISLKDDEALERAGRALLAKGVQAIVITLGRRGAFLVQKGMSELVPPFEIDPVDTTAAGDVFNGALAVSIAEQASLPEAVRFANAAAALSVTRLGAQTSAPYRPEIIQLLRSRT